MLNNRIKAALIVLAASAATSACTNLGPYGGVGVGVSTGYGGYGGYGSPYGYGYGSPWYGSYYGGYPYFGWYDGFYYPGSGYWLYDPWGRRLPMTERHSDYWSNMLKKFREARGAQAEVKESWAGFSERGKVSVAAVAGADAAARAEADQRSIRQVIDARRQTRTERQQQLRSERQQVRSERQQARSERQEAVRQQVIERRESRRARRWTDD